LPAAVIPSALVMVIVQVYDNHFALRSWWLALYLFLVLLLIGRSISCKSRIEWRRQHIAVSEDAWPDILNGLTVIALMAVLIAWVLPTSQFRVCTPQPMCGIKSQTRFRIGSPTRWCRFNLLTAMAG